MVACLLASLLRDIIEFIEKYYAEERGVFLRDREKVLQDLFRLPNVRPLQLGRGSCAKVARLELDVSLIQRLILSSHLAKLCTRRQT